MGDEGIEPSTSSLSVTRSTTELVAPFIISSVKPRYYPAGRARSIRPFGGLVAHCL